MELHNERLAIQSHHKILSPPLINGFSHKTNPMQIASYIVVVLLFVVFTLCILPALPLTSKIIAGVLFYPSYAAIIILGYLCTIFDPTDSVVIKEKTARLNNQEFDTSGFDCYCFNCEAHVSTNQSKHCRVCDRCVNEFDHHCKWLNNCVGKSNYKLFFGLIISVLTNTIVFTVFALIALFSYFFLNSDQEITNRLFFTLEKDPHFTMNFFQVVLWIFSCVGFIIAFFDGNLVLFHVYIMKKKITTYQYIINKREQASMLNYQREEQKAIKQRQKEERDRQIQQKKEEQIMAIVAQQKKEEQNSKNNIQSAGQIQQQQAAVSRQDSLDTHSQRTNNLDIFDSRRAFVSKNTSKFSDKLTTCGKIVWFIREKLLCCLQRKPKEVKVGAIIGLTRIEEQQSELMDDKDNLPQPQIDQQEDFPILNVKQQKRIENKKLRNFQYFILCVSQQMNERGLCHSIDVLEEGQLQKSAQITTPQSNNILNFQVLDPTKFLKKAQEAAPTAYTGNAVVELIKSPSISKQPRLDILNESQQQRDSGGNQIEKESNYQSENKLAQQGYNPPRSVSSKKNIDALSIHLSSKAALDSPKAQQFPISKPPVKHLKDPASLYKANSVSNDKRSNDEKKDNNSHSKIDIKQDYFFQEQISHNQAKNIKASFNEQELDASRSAQKVPHHPPEFNSISQGSQKSNELTNNNPSSDQKSIPQEFEIPHQHVYDSIAH